MRNRRQHAQHARIAEESVELLPAFEDGSAETVQRLEVLDVERNQRGRAADGFDLVVEFFKPAPCAPSAASALAAARPMPRDAPVTRTMRSWRDLLMAVVCYATSARSESCFS